MKIDEMRCKSMKIIKMIIHWPSERPSATKAAERRQTDMRRLCAEATKWLAATFGIRPADEDSTKNYENL